MTETFTIHRYAERLAVVRLPPGAEVPDWAGSGSVLSVTATATETSVVCGAASVPAKLAAKGGCERPYTAFVLQGPIDLALTGVLSGLIGPLAGAQIPVFTLSTFDTDWILVPEKHAEHAAGLWRAGGHAVEPAPAVRTPGGRS